MSSDLAYAGSCAIGYVAPGADPRVICDVNEFENGSVFRANICIVGAGAAGIAMALRLRESGRSVLLLESGGERTEAETQSLYRGEVVDASLHSAADKYRQRRLGGTTGIWGGRCVPFDEIDFERRPWIEGSGWPFGRAALLPYYAEANLLCEAGRFAYTVEQAFPAGARPLMTPFRGRSFTDNTLERFSCPTDFGRRYRARLQTQPGLRVVLHANVTEIRTSADGSVERLAVQSLKGRSFTAQADHYVLAMGGLEIPRLLLASRDHHANGIGNASDWVGRTYMCHIAGTAGEVSLGPGSSVWHGYEVAQDGVYCRRRFALTPGAQRELGVGNFVARLHHPRIPDPSHRTGALSALFLAKPFISFEYSKRLHGEGRIPAGIWARHVRNVALDPFGTAGFLLHWAVKRSFAERKFPSIIVRPRAQRYSIDFHAEQAPNRDSRIRLTGERDQLGMPRISIDWRYTPGDLDTVRRALGALAEDFAESGATLRCDAAMVDAAILRDGAYGGHHIGTTRMAASEADGVVDARCRVHGVRNLWIASSSVFPTSSQANPTLTLVAMALRLAYYLK